MLDFPTASTRLSYKSVGTQTSWPPPLPLVKLFNCFTWVCTWDVILTEEAARVTEVEQYMLCSARGTTSKGKPS